MAAVVPAAPLPRPLPRCDGRPHRRRRPAAAAVAVVGALAALAAAVATGVAGGLSACGAFAAVSSRIAMRATQAPMVAERPPRAVKANGKSGEKQPEFTFREGQRTKGKVVKTTYAGHYLINIGRQNALLLLGDAQRLDLPLKIGADVGPLWIKSIREKNEKTEYILTSYPILRNTSELQVGWKLKGTVSAWAPDGMDGVLVDCGFDKRGLLFVRDMSKEWIETASEVVELGQEIQVWVKDKREDGDHMLTMIKPRVPLDRLRMGKRHDNATVTNIAKFDGGGVFVDIGAVRSGWLPSREMLPDVKPVKGQALTVFIKEVKEGEYMVSMTKPRKPVARYRVGQQLYGNVTGVPGFGGAFIDVYAARDGVVNKMDMLNDSLAIGETVDVWVKSKRGDQLQLTMRKPRVQDTTLEKGSAVEGKVVSFPRFGGCLMDIGTVNDVLLTLEDLGKPAGTDVSEFMKVGDKMKLWVNHINSDGRIYVTTRKRAKEPRFSLDRSLDRIRRLAEAGGAQDEGSAEEAPPKARRLGGPGSRPGTGAARPRNDAGGEEAPKARRPMIL